MAGASLNPYNFEELIQAQGYNIVWEQAIVCECIIDGQPDMHCPLCQGKGWRYLPGRVIKGLTQSFSGKPELNIQGLREPGTAYLTPQLGVIMGFNDRVFFPDIHCKYSQVLTMGINETSSTYREIHDVNFVLRDQSVFQEGIDFEITTDKCHLKWIDEATKPKKGDKVSILYTTNPSYLVMDMTHELRSTNQHKDTIVPFSVELPKQYYIKREDFIYGHTINAKREEVKEAERLSGGELIYE